MHQLISRGSVLIEPDACESSEMRSRLKAGDEEAFGLLVEAHERMVLSLAQSMGFSSADLDDAAAEVFAEVFQSLPAFAGRSKLRTWIYTIAFRRLCRLRTAHRSARHDAVELEHVSALEDGPMSRAADAELYQRLWNAVRRLDARSAAAVELYYRQSLPLPEIAEALDCPVGTIKTLLFRARQTLRESADLRDERIAMQNGSEQP